MFKIKLNKYEILFVGIIFSQIFGIIGGFAQPIRVLSILVFFYLIDQIPSKISKDYKYFFLFFSVLILYSFLYLVFSFGQENVDDIFKSSFYNLINFITCFNLIVLSYKVRDLNKIIFIGWKVFYLIALPLSIYEILFNSHFVSFIEDDTLIGGTDKLKIYSSLTFGNYNTYNMVLLMSLPFLFNELYKKYDFLNVIILIVVSYIFLINGSRTTLIGIVISILFLLLFKRDFKSLMFLSICALIFFINIDKFEYTIGRINELGLNDSARMKMFGISFFALDNSNLLGIGPGSFSNFVLRNDLSIILAPHNFMLEILAEYGILIFLLLLIYLFNIFKFGDNNKFIMLLSAVLFFLIITVNSLYVQGVNIWLFLTLINLLSNNNDKSFNKKLL